MLTFHVTCIAANFLQLKTIFKLFVLKTFSFVNNHFWAYTVHCGFNEIIITSCFLCFFFNSCCWSCTWQNSSPSPERGYYISVNVFHLCCTCNFSKSCLRISEGSHYILKPYSCSKWNYSPVTFYKKLYRPTFSLPLWPPITSSGLRHIKITVVTGYGP